MKFCSSVTCDMLILRRRWLLWKLRWSSWGYRQLKTVRGWLKTGQWLCRCCTRLASHNVFTALYSIHNSDIGSYGKLWKQMFVHTDSATQEQDRLSALEKRYHTLTGGKNFPKPNSSMKEVSRNVWDMIRVVSKLEENDCKSQFLKKHRLTF